MAASGDTTSIYQAIQESMGEGIILCLGLPPGYWTPTTP